LAFGFPHQFNKLSFGYPQKKLKKCLSSSSSRMRKSKAVVLFYSSGVTSLVLEAFEQETRRSANPNSILVLTSDWWFDLSQVT